MNHYFSRVWQPGMRRTACWGGSRVAALTLLCLTLSGCATIDGPFIPDPIEKPPSKSAAPERGASSVGPERAERALAVHETPKPPSAQRSTVGKPAVSPELSEKDEAVASIALENMTIGQFANAIFGDILKRNVSIDPQVAQRSDMVTFRTGRPQTADQIFAAASALLRSYGIVADDYNATVRVLPDNAQTGLLPEIRRGRASSEVPSGLRPIFFLAELEHTSVAQTASWLRTLFQGKLTVQEDAARNALLLSGQSDTVNAAMETIALLDQPLMRGRVSARISPVFWSADEMGKRLVEMLQAEGYSVASNAGANTPILVLPVSPINSLIVFASNDETLNHVVRWAQELDQSPSGRAGNFINYHVRNTDAAELAATLSEVMGMSAQRAPTGAAGAVAVAQNAGSVVVNSAANSLIIKTTPAEFQQWYALLQELDRPARSALIMATVAEVRLTENEEFGFQWMLQQFSTRGYNVNLGTANPVSTSAKDGVFRVSIANLGGDPRALLTALASDNKIRILSNPSIVARNGQDASIQVGQEVPILTSQVSNANTGSTTGQGILQTIQYRNTGVILRVKPVIHAGGRIDLDVSQEVSAAQKTETGVESSPTILSRKIETKLSVSDGNTLLLGGLIQEQRTLGNAGIPYLKDLPWVGNLFKTSASDNKERTELVVLLTPYVMEDDFDAQAITEAFRSQFSWAKTLGAGPAADNASGDASVRGAFETSVNQ